MTNAVRGGIEEKTKMDPEDKHYRRIFPLFISTLTVAWKQNAVRRRVPTFVNFSIARGQPLLSSFPSICRQYKLHCSAP